MKHPQNPRNAARLAAPPQQQNQLAATSIPAPQQQNPFNARRSPAQNHPAAPKASPRYVVLRTTAVAIAQSLINVAAIRNHRKRLKTIASTHF
jgi:hypothetical protein